MPVIVIGADAPGGRAVVEALLARDGEVRAFVTDAEAGAALKARGVKVAIGDVSDGSHVEAASLAAFSAVVMAGAAADDRDRAFAASPDEVVTAWSEAIRGAGVTRTILVSDESVPGAASTLGQAAPEFAVVETACRDPREVADDVARRDEASSL